MKILMVNFGSETKTIDDCISVESCPHNTCDCEYNCYSDDDCTSDKDW